MEEPRAREKWVRIVTLYIQACVYHGIVDPRRACAARVTVFGLSAGLSICPHTNLTM